MTSCPYYFGPPEARLFGCYHAPPGGVRTRSGVLLCNPTGHEYMGAFRTVRQTALRFARTGAPALRFDYFGCGDSAGESFEGRPARWSLDILAALAELQQRRHGAAVAIVGLRLGASLAYRQLAEGRADARALILWDPVISGRTYVAELIAMQRARFGTAADEVLGFPFAAGVRTEIEAIDLMSTTRAAAGDVLIVETGSPRDQTRAFAARLRELGAAVEHREFPLAPLWHEPNKSSVHASIVQAVVEWTTPRL